VGSSIFFRIQFCKQINLRLEESNQHFYARKQHFWKETNEVIAAAFWRLFAGKLWPLHGCSLGRCPSTGLAATHYSSADTVHTLGVQKGSQYYNSPICLDENLTQLEELAIFRPLKQKFTNFINEKERIVWNCRPCISRIHLNAYMQAQASKVLFSLHTTFQQEDDSIKESEIHFSMM
jgi:hypothetical protein